MIMGRVEIIDMSGRVVRVGPCSDGVDLSRYELIHDYVFEDGDDDYL
mgnify:CR=1 FL=1